MIFLSTGTQLPFDRIIRWIDDWLDSSPYNDKIIVQSIKGEYKPRNIVLIERISKVEFDSYIKMTDIFISHAGIGNLMAAFSSSKSVIVVPRRYDLNEHRSDHQVATLEKFKDFSGVIPVSNYEDFVATLMEIVQSEFHSDIKVNKPKSLESLTGFLGNILGRDLEC